MKKFLSKDNKAEFTYYPSDKVEIRLRDYIPSDVNFCITVYKPGRCNINKNAAFASPVIKIGQNTTLKWGFNELKMLLLYIQEAIAVLNSEGYGIIDPNFVFSYSTVPYMPIKEKSKFLSSKSIVRNAVYEQENGRKYIFITKGKYYDYGGLGHPLNRESSDYVYLEVTRGDYTVSNGILVFNSRNCDLDSRANPRKFIRKVNDLPQWTRLVEVYGWDKEMSSPQAEYKF